MSNRKFVFIWLAVIVLAIAVPVRALFDHKLMFQWLAAAMIVAYFATWSLAVRARRNAIPGRIEVSVAAIAWISLLLSAVLLVLKMPTS